MSDLLDSRSWPVLRRMLESAREGSSFQQGRIGADGQALRSLDSFRRGVPLTCKADLVADQKAHPPYGSNHTEDMARYTRFCQTSGTSAMPLVVWNTEESWLWLLENWQRGYELAGVVPGMVAFFAFSFGPFLGFWTAFEAGLRMGLRCIPGGGLGTVARLSSIIEHQCEVLCCTPTYALHLARVARETGVDLSRSHVRKVLVAGEPGGSLPAVRQQLEAAWREAEVLDHYGLTELGPVAFAKAGIPGKLQILEDRYFAEVLDGEGNPVRDGATGELVLTPLGRSSWPLFRYQTGDLVCARRSESGLVLEGGILGRKDDMLIVRGVNLYPSAVDDVVRTISEVDEYRVKVTGEGGMAEVSVEVEVSGGMGVARSLEAAFERAFSLRIPVVEVAAGTLPRFELKARRWIR